MYYPYAGGHVAARDVREYVRVFQEIDGERRELAAFAARRALLRESFGPELARHKEHLYDLTELEEAMMIRTRYNEFGPHWRAPEIPAVPELGGHTRGAAFLFRLAATARIRRRHGVPAVAAARLRAGRGERLPRLHVRHGPGTHPADRETAAVLDPAVDLRSRKKKLRSSLVLGEEPRHDLARLVGEQRRHAARLSRTQESMKDFSPKFQLKGTCFN